MQKLIAGNWKMNGESGEAIRLVEGINGGLERLKLEQEIGLKSLPDVLICPPFHLLVPLIETLKKSNSAILIGGQNCHHEEKGAYTGDISAVMLKDIGCHFVIVGHSERRITYDESNALVQKKAQVAHQAGLKVIVCVGENEKQHLAGETQEFIKTQVLESLPQTTTATNTVIAYEPIWAIGTGKSATPSDAQAVHEAIYTLLSTRGGQNLAKGLPIVYGGSMKPQNAKSLLDCPHIDGGLIGGASLHCDDFFGIIKAGLTRANKLL